MCFKPQSHIFAHGYKLQTAFLFMGKNADTTYTVYTYLCLRRTSDGRGCANVALEELVTFNVSVTMDQCLPGTQTLVSLESEIRT